MSISLNTPLGTTESPRWKFKSDGGFECNMECMRCVEKTGNRRCRRKSCYTLPYCWQHLKLRAHLRVGRTTLVDPETGTRFPFRGLFACNAKTPGRVVFKNGDIITPYVGEVVSADELEERYPGNDVAPYAEDMEVDVGMDGDERDELGFVDGACVRGVASLANDALNGRCMRNGVRLVCRTNARFWSGGGNYPELKATRGIRDGEEIFVAYGKGPANSPENLYWSGTQVPHTTTPKAVYDNLEYKC